MRRLYEWMRAFGEQYARAINSLLVFVRVCVCARVRVGQGQEIRSGNRMSCLSRIIAPRSFRSRYSLVVSYARNTACMRHRGLPQT